MAHLSCVSTRPSCMPPTAWDPHVLIALAVATFALAGCNADQTIAPASQQSLAAIDPNYNPYNPIQYAQTSGFYAGR